MKKILASILCVALLLTTMSFSAFAATTPAPRTLEAVASAPVVYEDDVFYVNVVIDGDNIANAKWTLTYDPALVELTGLNTYPMTYGHGHFSDDDGVINDYHYLTDKDKVYENGAKIKSYRFKTLAQATDNVTCNFTLSNPEAYTWIESIDGIDAVTDCISTSVLIRHREFHTTTFFDGTAQTGSTIDFPYDNDTHTFEVVVNETDFVEDIIYTVNGVEKTLAEIEAMLKDVGTYEIKCEITAKDGYADDEVTFTVIIKDADFVVEVDTELGTAHDYVDGKKLVLVYTATANTYFEYNGNVMIDVSNSDYKYLGTVDYDYVFGFVTDAIDGGDLEDYKQKVSIGYGTNVAEKIEAYNTDINCTNDGPADIRDVTSIYGIYNVNTAYYADATRMLKILKADIDNSKRVEGIDIQTVTREAFPLN